MSEEAVNIVKSCKNNRQSAFGHDSLRFSYDFDCLSQASVIDHRQIQFEFEDYPEYEFKDDTKENQNKSNDESFDSNNATRKLGIFNKYRQNGDTSQQNSNDIGESFDKIFNTEKSDDIATRYFSKKKKTLQINQNKRNQWNNESLEEDSEINSSSRKDDDSVFDKIVIENSGRGENFLSDSLTSNKSQTQLVYLENNPKFILDRTSDISNSSSNPQSLTKVKNQVIETKNGEMNSSPYIFKTNPLFITPSGSKANAEDSSKKLQRPIFTQQQRVVSFLRQIRKMNSTYPNFNHPGIQLEVQQKFCNSLAFLFEKALITLKQIVLHVLEKANQPRIFPEKFRSLEFFTLSGWEIEKEKGWDLINSNIKPKTNLTKSHLDEVRIMKALENYKQVIEYYKFKKVDLRNEQGIKGYFKIREKFWNLEKNMRCISEDIYQIYPPTDYPQFYYHYLNVLKSPRPSKTDTTTLKYHQKVCDILIANQQRKEPLSISPVGQAVRMKIQRELKLLFPF